MNIKNESRRRSPGGEQAKSTRNVRTTAGKELRFAMPKKTDSTTGKGLLPKKTSPPLGGRKQQVRLKTLADLRRFLARIANDVDANIIEEGKARTMAYIISIMHAVIKDSDLEERILKLEKAQEDMKNDHTR
jgi:hypothetical protein